MSRKKATPTLTRFGAVLLGFLCLAAVAGSLLLGHGCGTTPEPRPEETVVEPPAPAREPFPEAALRSLRQRVGRSLGGLREGAKVSILAVDPATRQVLFERDAERSLVPASNMKLFTASALLDRAGPDHVIETRFMVGGPVEDGRLAGDLVVVGGGDPSISHRTDPGGAFAAMKALARELESRGLRRIDGRVVPDISAFSGPRQGENWPKDASWRTWMVDVTPLVFDDNIVAINCRPAGESTALSFEPDVGYGKIANRLQLTRQKKDHNVVFARSNTANEFTVSGKLWSNSTYNGEATVHRGEHYFAAALTRALREVGVEVAQDPDLSERPRNLDDLEVFFVRRTPIRELIGPMLKESQNLHAELLFRELAISTGHEGSFAGAAQAMQDWLRENDILRPGTRFVDGSGLSRSNAVSAGQAVDLLCHMAGRPQLFATLRAELAHPGEDGTLRSRMKDLSDRLAAKTGTLNSISALSGYVQAPDGRWLAFSAIFNSCVVAEAKAVQEQLCSALAELAP